MDDASLSFDFEGGLAAQQQQTRVQPPPQAAGQYRERRNFRQTVCRHWLRGLCMKGDACGFLHQFDTARMPVCRYFAKFGTCKEPDCPYKHSEDDIKDCNMFRLGFCVQGPYCRYRHLRQSAPPPAPTAVNASLAHTTF